MPIPGLDDFRASGQIPALGPPWWHSTSGARMLLELEVRKDLPMVPPPPANTQVSPPEKPSHPSSSNFSSPGPSSGWTKGRGWTRAAPSPVERHGLILKCSHAKGRGRKCNGDQAGMSRAVCARRGCLPGVQAGVHRQPCSRHMCLHTWLEMGCPAWCACMRWLHVCLCASPELTSEIPPAIPGLTSPVLAATHTSTDVFRMFSSSISSNRPCCPATAHPRSQPSPSHVGCSPVAHVQLLVTQLHGVTHSFDCAVHLFSRGKFIRFLTC